ncbi:Uncharacterised protein [uncultured archaeon]|nr:Uncharacterised protein [uncultured archaeon]
MAAFDGYYNSGTLIPGNIIAVIKEDLSVKDAAELIVEKVTDSLIQEIVREERYSLRSEKIN